MYSKKLHIDKLALVAIVCIVLTAVLSYYIKKNVFYTSYNRLGVSLSSMRSQRPEAVSLEAWDAAVSFTMTAYSNTCSYDEYISNKDLLSFERDVEVIKGTQVSPDTILCIWDRMALMGPHAAKYISNNKPYLIGLLNGRGLTDVDDD